MTTRQDKGWLERSAVIETYLRGTTLSLPDAATGVGRSGASGLAGREMDMLSGSDATSGASSGTSETPPACDTGACTVVSPKCTIWLEYDRVKANLVGDRKPERWLLHLWRPSLATEAWPRSSRGQDVQTRSTVRKAKSSCRYSYLQRSVESLKFSAQFLFECLARPHSLMGFNQRSLYFHMSRSFHQDGYVPPESPQRLVRQPRIEGRRLSKLGRRVRFPPAGIAFVRIDRFPLPKGFQRK